MDPSRRRLMRGTASLGTVGLALSAGLLPKTAFAAWPAQAFSTHGPKRAVALAEGIATDAIKFSHVTITAPDIAENGAVVPVTVESDLPNVAAISVFAEKNPYPLNSEFALGEGVLPYVSTRIRLAETQNVMGLVKTSDGKVYGGVTLVKVTIGGCGG